MQDILQCMPFIWGSIIIITVVIALFSTDIDAIWFSIGASLALITSLFKIHIAVQLSVFVFATILLLFVIGKPIKKLLMKKNITTNSDSLIGKEILILKTVDEFNNGSGVVEDVVWTVICQAGVAIEKGKHAIIIAIDGNKLVVTNKE